MSDLPPQDPPQTPIPNDEPAPDTVLAAEHALGLTDAEEAARAEARAASEPAFAAEAAAWTLRLHPLAEELADISAPDSLWPRVARAAGWPEEAPAPEVAPPAAQATSRGKVVAFPTRALALWRAGALIASAVAAACVVAVALLSGRQIAPPPLLVANLDPPTTASSIASEPLFTATLDPARHTVVMSPVSPGPVDPRARELWLIPADGKPRAAGLLDVQNTRRVPLTPELLHLASAGAKLAVSLEPEGGAPNGVPTGPIIAAGVLTRI